MTDLSFYENRLAKNARHRNRWAQREGVFAYRLYERDIPEFPVIVDRYDTDEGTRVYLQEVDRGWRQSETERREWLDLVVAATATTLGVDPGDVVTQSRWRQRAGGDKTRQYAPSGIEGEMLTVREGPYRFWINLGARVDTGLFLDHRITRARVASEAAGRRVLNLFAYTGSFTVHAAGAGARSSVSVDLSNTYLDWAQKNLSLNGLASPAHELVRADVMDWLRIARPRGLEFDLIVLDPPSFSNSKKMQGVLDVQRDHAWLIGRCLELLAPGGCLYFSTNLRRFTLDPGLAQQARIEDLSQATLPPDFRDPRIHQCYRIERL